MRRKSPELTIVDAHFPLEGGYGKYHDAVKRWEEVMGSAPEPVIVDEKGKRRLNLKFAEWLMGIPAGRVTGEELNLTRAKQLRIIGNGVVPHQAAKAIQTLRNKPKENRNG